ncbi:IS3 family transposase [Aerococcus mictus]|uniref:IS3 family transposase n=1 Tax=Aerococcus mictus TaxID=2976810 RepID=UPI00227A0D99|nr:IS3 family transposase [Aerococcus mictus]MCY3076804.1 IS3 family transposase [Aerococcus mictus]
MRKKVTSLAAGRGSRSKEKTKIILKLLKENPQIKINEWLKIAKLPKSSYYEWKIKLEQPIDKDKEIRKEITTIVEASKGRYGYRRVTMVLKNKGFNINHKKVLRIMREESLLCTKFKTRSRKYSSYKGQIGKVADNLVKRQFKASKPNELWLTDVTEFRIKGQEKKLYLSPILDLYNSEIISYTLSNHPTTELTNTMLEKALEENKDIKDLIIHSDQGFHYQHSTWTKKLEKMNIRQSMSRKGNCLDNSPMENFFAILKQEMYYGVEFKNYDELISEIKKYIKWYNEDRIKTKLNGMSPVMYRLHSA